MTSSALLAAMGATFNAEVVNWDRFPDLKDFASELFNDIPQESYRLLCGERGVGAPSGTRSISPSKHNFYLPSHCSQLRWASHCPPMYHSGHRHSEILAALSVVSASNSFPSIGDSMHKVYPCTVGIDGFDLSRGIFASTRHLNPVTQKYEVGILGLDPPISQQEVMLLCNSANPAANITRHIQEKCKYIGGVLEFVVCAHIIVCANSFERYSQTTSA